MATVSLNSTSFTPNSISEETEKIGTEIDAEDGSRRFAHRAHKRKWTLEWKNVTAATRSSLRTIHVLTTTFAFVDEAGTSYTVHCRPGAWKSSLGAVTVEGGVTTLRWNVTLVLTES